MLFSELNLKQSILDCLDKQGYKEPTKIQEEVIKVALEGKSIIGQSQTGTGKTAAFVIPLLSLIDGNIRKPQAIIMAPTRELANQIREEIVKLSDGMYIRSTAVFGGSNIRTQREILDKGPQIIVATPGRLIDLIERRYINLQEVKYFVLDEADRMLDMGFIDDIDHIWANMPNITQSMTFSATIPQEIKNLLAKYVGEGYEFIKATEGVTVAKIDHSFVEVPHFDKYEMLKKHIAANKDKKIVVFARMKHETEDLADRLAEDGYIAGFLHGDMQQRDRARSLKRFQDGACNIFITTDVAARGLNMKDIELVVNFHVPEDPEAYIHRIGRTGRAGAEGRAIMFVSNQERHFLQNIERRNKITIKQVDAEGNEIVRVMPGMGGGHHHHGSRKTFGGGSRGGFGGGRPPRRDGESRGFGGRTEGRTEGGYRGGESRGGFGKPRTEGGGYAPRSEGSGFAPRAPRSDAGGYAPRAPRADRGGSDWGFGGGYQGRKPSNDSEGGRSRSEGGYQGRNNDNSEGRGGFGGGYRGRKDGDENRGGSRGGDRGGFGGGYGKKRDDAR